MVKFIGVLLILSSLLSLIAGTFIDFRYGSAIKISGNVVSNIITQPSVSMNFFDYFEAVAYSYSVIGFIMGFVFLFMV